MFSNYVNLEVWYTLLKSAGAKNGGVLQPMKPNHFRAETKVRKLPALCGCLLESGWHNRIQQLVGTSIA